jgi:hypothetical protein
MGRRRRRKKKSPIEDDLRAFFETSWDVEEKTEKKEKQKHFFCPSCGEKLGMETDACKCGVEFIEEDKKMEVEITEFFDELDSVESIKQEGDGLQAPLPWGFKEPEEDVGAKEEPEPEGEIGKAPEEAPEKGEIAEEEAPQVEAEVVEAPKEAGEELEPEEEEQLEFTPDDYRDDQEELWEEPAEAEVEVEAEAEPILDEAEMIRTAGRVRRDRILFYSGAGLLILGGPIIALSSWLHDWFRVPIIGDSYTVFGWINFYFVIAGLIIFFIGIILFAVSLRGGIISNKKLKELKIEG